MSYDLEYAPGHNLPVPWTPAGHVATGVRRRPRRWDTTTLPDGRYVLRLRMNRRDDMPPSTGAVVVANATPTPTSPPPTRTPTAVPGTPPSPSPPRRLAAATHAAPGRAGANADAGPAIPPTRSAHRSSPPPAPALIAVGTFGLLGLYALVRASGAGSWGFWRVREVINPLLDALQGRRTTESGSRRTRR